MFCFICTAMSCKNILLSLNLFWLFAGLFYLKSCPKDQQCSPSLLNCFWLDGEPFFDAIINIKSSTFNNSLRLFCKFQYVCQYCEFCLLEQPMVTQSFVVICTCCNLMSCVCIQRRKEVLDLVISCGKTTNLRMNSFCDISDA